MSNRFLNGFAVLFFASSSLANAADLPSRRLAPVYDPPIVAAWTGCYAGVEGGGSFARTRSVGLGLNNGAPIGIPAGTPKNDTDLAGGLAGGTVGCNYQIQNWVVGLEGDGSWANSHGSSVTPPPFNTNFNEDPTQRWLATARARLGYAVRPNVLIYATAGGAFSELGIHEYSRVTGISASESHTYSGWTAGAGAEWMFAPNWSAKVEYLYADLGKQNYFAATANGCCSYQATKFTDHIVRAGVNYHINWASAPVVARY